MSAEAFTRQIEAAHQRLLDLEQRASESGEPPAVTLEVLEELSTAMEELHVAAEELHQQNEELVAARHIAEAERQRYQELFEFAPDGYLVTDPEGIIREANRAAAALLGVRQDFLIGKPLLVFVAEPDRHTFHTRLTELHTTAGIRRDLAHMEIMLQPRAGEPFLVSLTVGLVRAADRQLVGLRWLVRDITERKQAERALEEYSHDLNERVKELSCLYSISEMVRRNDLSRGELSQASAQLLAQAYQFPEMTACRITWGELEYSTEDFQETPWSQKRAILVHGEPAGSISVCYLEERPEEDEGPFLAEERKLVNAVADLLGRAVERKQAEEVLRKAYEELELRVQERTQELTQANEVLRTVLETLPVGVWIIDQQGNITHGNRASQAIWAGARYVGIEQYGEYKGWWLSTGQRIKPDEWAAARAVTKGETSLNEEVKIECFDGSHKMILNSAVPIRNAAQEILGAVIVNQDITRRKQMEAALQLERNKLRSILHAMHDGVYIVNQQNVIEYINPTLEQEFGSIDGRRCYEYFHGRSEVCPWCKNQEVFAGKSVTWEWESSKTGKTYELFDTPLRNDDGSVSKLEFFHDITERKQAEKRLRVQTTAIEAAANGVIITDRRGHIEWCNLAFTHMTGYAADEVLGQNPRLLKSGQHPPGLYQQLWTTILAGRTWRGEMINRRKDGSYYTEEQTITPVLDDDGQISHFIAIKQDITDRKRAEELIRMNAAQVEVMAEISRAMVEASLDYQTLLDIVAQGATKLVGGTCAIHLLSEDRQWFKLAAVFHADPEASSYLQQLLASEAYSVHESPAAQVAQTGQPLLMPIVSLEQLRAVMKPEHRPYLDRHHVSSLLIVPLHLRGQFIGTLAVGREQSEQPLTHDDQLTLQRLADRAALAIDNARLYKDLARTLQEEQDMREQLVQAEKFAALGRIVAAVAHELNNPLQTIQNCLFLSRQEIRPDAPSHEYLQMAADEVQRLSNLVAQLRTLQRSRASSPLQTLDLRPLLEEVHVLISPQLEAHQIQWQLTVEREVAVVSGGADQLKQVFLNIGQNAIEAMQTNGGVLRVGLMAANGEQIAVSFQDSGAGIAPENLSKILEPLFTTKPHGLGLGLPICYEIVQRHGGRMTINSELAQGTTVTVWLPAAAHVSA